MFGLISQSERQQYLHYYGKVNQLRTGLDSSFGFQDIQAPIFQENELMKVVRLSDLRSSRLYPRINIPGIRFSLRLIRPVNYYDLISILISCTTSIYLYCRERQ